VLSGKVFEYLAAERPILASVPPEGAAADLIRKSGSGVVAPPDDPPAIREALEGLYARWQAGTLSGPTLDEESRRRISRETRVGELADLLQTLG
jgi:glycosyltransferase involved in cell wall biosynthesis